MEPTAVQEKAALDCDATDIMLLEPEEVQDYQELDNYRILMLAETAGWVDSLPIDAFARGYRYLLVPDPGHHSSDTTPLGIYPESSDASAIAYVQRLGHTPEDKFNLSRLNIEACYEGCSDSSGNQEDYPPLINVSPPRLQQPYDTAKPRRTTSLPKITPLPTPEQHYANQVRLERWYHVERFMRQVYRWAQSDYSPKVHRYQKGSGPRRWYFDVTPCWNSHGIHLPQSCFQMLEGNTTGLLHAAWNYLWYARQRWLKAHPGQCWLAEYPYLHLIRYGFTEMLRRCQIPVAQWPEIKEDPKPTRLNELEQQLQDLQDREQRALIKLHNLQLRPGGISRQTARRARDFLQQLMDAIDQVQRQLQDQAVWTAINQGIYHPEAWYYAWDQEMIDLLCQELHTAWQDSDMALVA